MLKSMSFPLTLPNRTSNGRIDFSLQSPEFYSCIQFEIRKKVGLLILLNCDAASLTVFIVHSLSSGKVEMFLCAACHAFTPHVNAWKR